MEGTGAPESPGRFGATCTEVKVKATEINENSEWEEALGMDIYLREKTIELMKCWQKEGREQESMETCLSFKREFQESADDGGGGVAEQLRV